MAQQKEQTLEGNGHPGILVDPEIARGAYSNLAIVRHSPEDFTIDFLVQDPNGPAHLVARVFTNPPHMKRLVEALTDNLRKYEQKFGQIEARPLVE